MPTAESAPIGLAQQVSMTRPQQPTPAGEIAIGCRRRHSCSGRSEAALREQSARERPSASPLDGSAWLAHLLRQCRPTARVPDPRARFRPADRPGSAATGPAAPASSRSAKPRTAFSGVRRSCASRRASSAAVGGSAALAPGGHGAGCSRKCDNGASFTLPSTPSPAEPPRLGCAEAGHVAQSRGSSSAMLRLQRLAGG